MCNFIVINVYNSKWINVVVGKSKYKIDEISNG